MAKYYGMLGFAEYDEPSPGEIKERIVERPYYGDLNRNLRRTQTATDKVNDDFAISNEVSIVIDPYATQNFYRLRYLTFMGVKWKVTSVEIRYPRLVVNLGGIYNE